MAITLLEGFKYLPSAANRYAALVASNGVTTWTRQAGRTPGSFALSAVNSVAGDTGSYAAKIRLPVDPNVYSVGFAAYHRANMAAPEYDAVGITHGVSVDRTPAVSLCTGSSVGAKNVVYNGMSAAVMNDASPITIGWHWWNITFVYSTTVGFFRVYRDGVLCWSIAPDTIPISTQNTIIDLNIGNCNAASAGVYIADLVIRNDSNLIPDTRVDVLAPTSDSAAGWTRSAGTTNFSLVDDAGPTVDVSDYVSSATVGATDTYGVADLPHSPASIYAVGVHAIGRKDSGGSREAAVMVNSAEGTSMDTGSSGTVYNYWETNPSGGAAWTKANVDAMTAGIKIKT